MLELYGINHGGHVVKDGLHVGRLAVKPSHELLHRFENLPPGKKVGLEYHPDQEADRVINGLVISGESPAFEYWNELRDCLQRASAEVVYLEDPVVYENAVHARIASREANEALRKYYSSHEWNPPEVRELNESKFSADAIADYAFIVSREKAILDRIALFRPDIALLGQGHVEYLLSGGTHELAQRGIIVTGYHREGIAGQEPTFMELLTSSHGYYSERAELTTNATANLQSALVRQNISRRYNAVTTGRVEPQRDPQFVGTWDTMCRPHGLFELYTEGDAFGGTIEDLFGTATFEGTINKQRLEFVKLYDREKSLRTADEIISFEPVEYQATSKDGLTYQGRYSNPKVGSGEFILSRGDTLIA